jgi:hypothetical protein
MPCYQAEESNNEVQSRRMAALVVILDRKMGLKTPEAIIRWSNATYENHCDILTPLLCSRLNALTPEQLDQIVYNGRDKDSRRLADWFDEHKEWDAKRRNEE